jgi:1,4-alpha-glucan branching enzyme
MATKKQSTPAVVAEKPAKTAKAEKAVKVAETTVEKVVKAEKAPKAEATAKTAPKAAKSVKITFVLPKEAVENAETVALLGDFNNWQNGLTLAKQKDGSFQTAVELEKGRSYEYRFLINGEKWENDWAAEAYAPTPFGTFNSVVTA